MTMFRAQPTLDGLKQFQRRTVDHVFNRFYADADAADRFLVADETGLGKSLVAAGVVAKVIEHLETCDDEERIDIVYICSNADLARQNIARINVTGQNDVVDTGRLSLLPQQLGQLGAQPLSNTGKRVNFVSLTPGTSFNNSRRIGNKEERASVFHMLESVHGDKTGPDGLRRFRARTKRRAVNLLRGGAEAHNFVWHIEHTDADGFPPEVVETFRRRAEEQGLTERFEALLHGGERVDQVREELMPDLIGAYRGILAEAGLDYLEPDLIILDEFQRFNELLYTEGRSSGIADLAQRFLTSPGAKLLLLSATPYKAHTNSDDDGDDHARDFKKLLGFLAGDYQQWSGRLDGLLSQRRAQLAGLAPGDNAADVEHHLKRYMCRTERPQLGHDDMLRRVTMAADDVRATDLRSYRALSRVSETAGTGSPLEYWKSVPYFANFLTDYQLGKVIDGRVDGPAEQVRPLLKSMTTIDRARHRRFEPLEGDNAKYREVQRHVLDGGIWRLLWMPASHPYTRPGGPFAEVDDGVTKQVLFSAWSAAPTAISTLLSYEAERRMISLSAVRKENTAETRDRLRARFAWGLKEGEPNAMSALALFAPHASQAQAADPLALAGRWAAESSQPTADDLRRTAEDTLRALAQPTERRDDRGLWAAYFGIDQALPESWNGPEGRDRGLDAIAELDLASSSSGEPEQSNFQRHIQLMFDTANESAGSWRDGVGEIALYSPANCAYRALGRILPDGFDPADHWRAALIVAEGLRTLFNRQDTTALLEHHHPHLHYWQAVLRYCADGNLQAVLDEYVFQLRSQQPRGPVTAEQLERIAKSMRSALSLTISTLAAKYPGQEETLAMGTRFAVRYGGGRNDDGTSHRTPEVRQAFNSPFWPFVLTTTSVGQEGIDFHWWSHSVIHWNVPSNPVDFEQREGRVHRYMGHAVRKNVAAVYGPAVLADGAHNPWAEMFRRAEEGDAAKPGTTNEFAPYWVYPGEHKIERRLLEHPLSRDVPRRERMLDGLAVYRLALGQARQEDLLELIEETEMRPLDLRP